MKRNRLLCLVLIYAIFPQVFVKTSPGQQTLETKKGLQFRLREGAENAAKKETAPNAEAAKSSAAETEAILNRLPPMDAETTDKTDFSVRPDSLPPPKTGRTIAVKFAPNAPPDAPQVENSVSALEILRSAPSGEVSLAPDLSVTFSQPMIAVASQTDASKTVPVKLTPEVKGKWRWLGTRTLAFDADSRFPMATRYTATIPAGTKSVNGARLEKGYSWNFETPPARVEDFKPVGTDIKPDAILFAKFNQTIAPSAVLEKISATANGQKIALRLAEKSEIERDEKLSDEIKTLLPNRWIAFRAIDLLPVDTKISISFETGMPSAEGDLRSVAARSFAFRTYGNLKFVKSFCGWDERPSECRAYEDFKLEFNNLLDEKSFDESRVKIEPKLENAQISLDGNEIHIGGAKNTRTNYKVTVSEKLKDEFGQTLRREVSTEFKTGANEAELSAETDGNFVTLDPFALKRTFSVFSTNYKSLDVKIYAVKAENYEAFYRYKQGDKTGFAGIGDLVYEKTVKVKANRDVSAETKINLTPAMPNGVGHAILTVAPTNATSADEKIVVWLQATNIGVDAFGDYEQLTVFASDLKSGKVLPNVSLQTSNGASGATNENGLASLELPAKYEERGDWLIARNGADTAILLENNYYNSDKNWSRKTQSDGLRWFVFDDRQMYRPGETVSVKGYVRKIAGGKAADVEALNDAIKGLRYVLRDSVGREVLSGNADLNSFGAFDFQLKLPENINLGSQSLRLITESKLENYEHTHQFQVQEFRRPEFEVSAKSETAAPFYVGGSATVSAEAKYYAGGALANSDVNWNVTSKPTSYTPPNRDDFTFGKFVPWWGDYYESDDDERTSQTFKGMTDASGKHFLALDFTAANPSLPYQINAEARVQDVNRQTFAAATDLLVHPSELYVGLRTAKTFVGKGEKFRVETITTDIDGKAIADTPVSLTAELKDWEKVKGEWQKIKVDTQTCQIKSANDVASCEFQAKRGGEFTITASVSDKKERRNESELTVWVAGANREPSREIEKETVELVPEKKEYAPGETAEILVNAPFFPAEGVLTLRRGGVVKTERFTMNEASIVLRIPIEEKFLPNIYAQVDLSGATKRIVFDDEKDDKLPKRPAFASGALNLAVSTAQRELKVAAEPQDSTLEPGGATTINVAVADHDGKPAPNTEVALVAVDESVLALTNYKISNPIDVFYKETEAGTSDYYSRENVLLASPEDLIKNLDLGYGNGRGQGSGDGYGNGNGDDISVKRNVFYAPYLKRTEIGDFNETKNNPNQIRIRRNFEALAIFSPSVRTDANGKATVKINLPDNLTRYRITAIAGDGAKRFGKIESNITARQSLMIRPSAPRFMNFADRAELPVVVQNQTDKPLTVDVAVRASNAELTDGNGRKITVAANDRAEVRFPLTTEKTGIARFQIGAVSGNLADAAEFAFPVLTPATSEAFATYGTTDEAGAIMQSIQPPTDVFREFGGLEITTSSTQLQELTDAFIYLQNYPFECNEQISSRILSVAALRDVLQAFGAKDLPTREQIEAKMTADIERLRKLQHKDGGFSFWSATDESLPYLSVHVAHALARAKAKGYAVPDAMTQKLQNYLKNIEAKYPNYYSEKSRRAISAYALYVRDLMNDKDAGKARKLLAENGLEKLSAESLGWILAVLADDKDSGEQVESIKRNLLNRATETAGAAHFTTDYTDGEYVLLSSDRRTDGVILESLLKAEPNNDLIPKIVRGLLAGKTKGRWSNTQENAFVLLALDKYFQTYEKVTPNFAARIWFGNSFAGEMNFAGREVDSKSINVPMNLLQQTNAAQNLILDKQGNGRLYYRIGLKYAPRNLNLSAADYGFEVTRSYEAIDDPADVRLDANGGWTIKSGVRVRVRLQMFAPVRRYHVALVDNLPAGLEIVNTNLAVTESLPEDEKIQVGYYDNSRWFDHENLRDERAEIFKALLTAGVWNYSYVARATTSGTFTAPPAKAEEMYAPETFGRSKTDFVRIE